MWIWLLGNSAGFTLQSPLSGSSLFPFDARNEGRTKLVGWLSTGGQDGSCGENHKNGLGGGTVEHEELNSSAAHFIDQFKLWF